MLRCFGSTVRAGKGEDWPPSLWFWVGPAEELALVLPALRGGGGISLEMDPSRPGRPYVISYFLKIRHFNIIFKL